PSAISRPSAGIWFSVQWTTAPVVEPTEKGRPSPSGQGSGPARQRTPPTDEAGLVGVHDGLDPVPQAQLGQDVADMGPDRRLRLPRGGTIRRLLLSPSGSMSPQASDARGPLLTGS